MRETPYSRPIASVDDAERAAFAEGMRFGYYTGRAAVRMEYDAEERDDPGSGAWLGWFLLAVLLAAAFAAGWWWRGV